MTEQVLQFWGKAQPIDGTEGGSPVVPWHPLAYHSLDVAAVGQTLLRRNDRLASLFDRLDLEPAAVQPLLCLLLALHDIGKFSRPFQAKAPAHYPPYLGTLPSMPDPGHGRSGLALWETALADLAEQLSFDPFAVDPLAKAVLGHHGAPVEALQNAQQQVDRLFGKGAAGLAKRYAEAMLGFFSPGKVVLDEEAAKDVSFPLAGFAVLCDWIGSNQQWFPYVAPTLSLEDYWRTRAVPQAERAVREAGILPARSAAHNDYDSLTRRGEKDRHSFVPTPMQLWAKSVDLPDGPLLVLIEDDTGSGKTEAAVMLAHRLISAGKAAGLYVALPTMATANAMFDRLASVYRNLFAPDAEPSLSLAHGARNLHPGFRGLRLGAGRREAPYGGTDAEVSLADDEVTASSACADWIADDRRRAFLADVGAGTIDQALLSVLPSKFQSLRLLGLCQRVLILDEIHAYDAYMQQEIVALLRTQASLGGSAVLLSATLPESLRRRFVGAFQRGLGEAAQPAQIAGDRSYPLATLVSRAASEAHDVTASRRRRVPLRFLDSVEAALNEAAEAARAGRAVLYIRNAVDDVLEAAAALQAKGLAPLVFHARFALADRLAREKEVMETFGPDSRAAARAGKLLVATQVVEQSLDLDFDLVISDLAPVDLLIQRAGRLWRHDRPRPPGACELLVVSPSPVADADGAWFRGPFPRAAAVYRNHAQLWLTAKALQDSKAIESPDGLRPLIEAVYGEDADRTAPAALERFALEAEGKDSADRSIAQQNVLKLSEGYLRGSGAWEADVRTPTRLQELPRMTLRLARLEAGRIVPWAPKPAGAEPWLAWRLSECQVRQDQVAGEAAWPPELAPLVEAAKADWGRFDDDKLLVLLHESEESGVWQSTVQGPNGPQTASYDENLGLTLTF